MLCGEVEILQPDYTARSAGSTFEWEHFLPGVQRDKSSGIFLGNDGAYHAGVSRSLTGGYTLAVKSR